MIGKNPPLDREEQTELAEPIKVRWTGKLRSRVQERHWDYAATKNEEGDWVVSDDADPRSGSVYRTLTRQKTNVVIQTVEEAKAFYGTMGHYRAGGGREGITWMNGPMVKTAKRVSQEVLDAMKDRGFQPVWNTKSFGRTLTGFERVD